MRCAQNQDSKIDTSDENLKKIFTEIFFYDNMKSHSGNVTDTDTENVTKRLIIGCKQGR